MYKQINDFKDPIQLCCLFPHPFFLSHAMPQCDLRGLTFFHAIQHVSLLAYLPAFPNMSDDAKFTQLLWPFSTLWRHQVSWHPSIHVSCLCTLPQHITLLSILLAGVHSSSTLSFKSCWSNPLKQLACFISPKQTATIYDYTIDL